MVKRVWEKKRIDGKVYHRLGHTPSLKQAREWAKTARVHLNARVISEEGGFAVYVKEKKYRG